MLRVQRIGGLFNALQGVCSLGDIISALEDVIIVTEQNTPNALMISPKCTVDNPHCTDDMGLRSNSAKRAPKILAGISLEAQSYGKVTFT